MTMLEKPKHKPEIHVVSLEAESQPIKYRQFKMLVSSLVLVMLAFTLAHYIPSSHASSPITNTCSKSSLLVPSCGVLWGAYVPSYGLTNLENQVGRQFDVFQEYHDFSTTSASGKIPNSSDQTLMNGGRILLASWQPINWSTSDTYSWQSIADGSEDSTFIIPQADSIKAIAPTKIFLSFAPEMDGHNSTVYGTASQFIAAYEHIFQVFAEQGVTNVVWDWDTTGDTANNIASYYPSGSYNGQPYVNWIGYDPYNFYKCNSGETTVHSPLETFSTFYNWVQAGNLGSAAKTLPMMLDEYGSANDADDPPVNGQAYPNWYSQIPTALAALPNIKGLSEFDSVGICTTELTSSADLAGFTGAGLSSTVTGQSPKPPPDTTPPTASITSPSNGATVSGTLTIDVSASDNVGVTKVNLLIDGVSVASDASSPWNFNWDSTTVANGSHTIQVKAYDAAGNVGQSSSVAITVSNNSGTSPPPTPSPPPTTSPPPRSPSPGSTTNTNNPPKLNLSPNSSKNLPVTVTNGNLEINPIIASTSESDPVTKTEYYLNSKLLATVTMPPFNYSVNTKDVFNGKYNLIIKVYYLSGKDVVYKSVLNIKNPFSLRQLWLGMLAYDIQLSILLILVIGLVLVRIFKPIWFISAVGLASKYIFACLKFFISFGRRIIPVNTAQPTVAKSPASIIEPSKNDKIKPPPA